MSGPKAYPVRVEATRDERLSRWLWAVKWLLAIPHYVVLAFLWPAFVLLSVAAFVAILVTGRYPRPIFDFNVGVMRWTWRVQHYAYGALGTDRYPPFTLADVPDYPAHVEVEYPERLSRGLALVKWWLLAIPHYVFVAAFLGGVGIAVQGSDFRQFSWGTGGIVGVLVVVAGVVLAVTGRYPAGIYDAVVGMDRWAVRVVAYAGLMTDVYPPFRLDVGGSEPGPVGAAPSAPPAGHPAGPAPSTSGWTAGRVTSLVIGAVVTAGSVGLLAGGSALLWADRTQRDDNGFLTSSQKTYHTAGSALTSGSIDLHGSDRLWRVVDSAVGDVTVRVAAPDPSRAVFVGVAPFADAERYLSGVAYTSVGDLSGPSGNITEHPGGNVSGAPDQAGIWVARAAGPGAQTLTWKPADGRWTVVAMYADGSAGVEVAVQAGAELPALSWIGGGLVGGGLVLLLGGVLLMVVPVTRASRAVPGVAQPEPFREPVAH